MSLQQRSRAVAGAGHLREQVRLATALIAIGFLVSGAVLDNLVLVVLGGVAAGSAIGQMSLNPERIYMEGFSDGLVVAADIDGAPATGRAGEHRPHLRGLPGGAGADDGPAAGGAADEDQRGAGAGEPDAPGPTDLAAAVGLHLEPRPHRSALDTDGSPIESVQGPRQSIFPSIVPPAEPSRSPVRIEPGPGAGRKARRSQQSFK